jgi:hypothetical protein
MKFHAYVSSGELREPHKDSAAEALHCVRKYVELQVLNDGKTRLIALYAIDEVGREFKLVGVCDVKKSKLDTNSRWSFLDYPIEEVKAK